MSVAALRILVVGNSTASTESTLKALARSGWDSQSVKTVREAGAVLRTIRFHLTLAAEKPPDGTGYELAALIAQQSGNLFISVPLSETCLWLPAVEKGTRSLGQRALDPLTLTKEAEVILRACDTAVERPESERNGSGISLRAVVGAEGPPARAIAQLTETERFGRQVRESYEHGEVTEPRRPIAARRQLLRTTSGAVEHPLPLQRGGLKHEVAVDECWLLICGYTERDRRSHMGEDFGEREGEDGSADSCGNYGADDFQATSLAESCEEHDRDGRRGNSASLNEEDHDRQRVAGPNAPRPFCVVALRAKVDPGRSVAVLSNGLLAIRMGKVGLERLVPCVS
jgi:hypothetical protein